MSGISGWSFFSAQAPYIEQDAEVMCETIIHRGEERGIFKDSGTLFSYCHKEWESPFYNDEKSKTCIAFDGEIYNKKELVYELEHLGHKFYEKSDAEIVLKSYMQWGHSFVSRLNGGFAFVIYEAASERLFLARDKFGTKPLFYKKVNGGITFASEAGALLSLPDSTATVGSDGLCTVLGLWGIGMPTDTVFREINTVAPAHFVVADSASARSRLYWEPIADEHRENFSNTAEKVRYLVKEAVSRRMHGGAKDGVLLSGDLGSSIICALGASQYAFERGERLDTYSLEYKDTVPLIKRGTPNSNADKAWILRMCEEFSTRHKIISADSDEIISLIEKSVTALDMPGANKQDLLLFSCFSRLAKKNRCIHTGDGADDMFGSREWFKSGESFRAKKFPWLAKREDLSDLLNDDMAFYLNSEAYTFKKYRDYVAKTPRLKSENEFEARRRELFYLNRTIFSPYITEKKNALAEYFGVSLCMPFCDGALAEYVWNIPWNIKAPAGTDKGVLRLAMKAIVPDDVNDRHHNNHATLHTPALDKKILALASEVLCEKSEPIADFLDIRTVAERIETGRMSSDTALYLLEFNIWLKQYGVVIK